MSGLVGLALGAASGLGQAAQRVGEQMQKADDQKELMAMLQDAEAQKAERIARFNNDLANAPMNRAGKYLQDAVGTDVPQTAPTVTSLSGYMGADNTTKADGSPNVGMVGSVDELKAAANALTDPKERTAALAQIDQQQQAEQGLVGTAFQGATRAPTLGEAIKSAQQKAAEAGDMQAYQALKTMGTDRFMSVADGAALIDTNTGQLVFQNGDKADRYDKRTEAMEKRTLLMLDTLSQQQANNLARTNIASLDTDIKSKTTQIGALNDQLLTAKDKEKPEIKAQIKALMEEISDAEGEKRAYLKTLGGAQGVEKSTPQPANGAPIATLPPGAKQIGTSGGKPVYETPDGKRFLQQ